MEISYAGFKNTLITEMKAFGVEVCDEGDWMLKITIDDDNYFSIDLKVPWNKYLETQSPEVLHSFYKTQIEIIEWVLKTDYSFDQCKDRMLYAIRSSNQLKKLKSKDSIIAEKIGEDLFGVVILNHTRFTEYFNQDQIEDSPGAAQILKESKENTLKQGWGQENQTHNGNGYEILAFNEHSSHYQFFIPEWLERKVGDCYFALPSSRVALVLKFDDGIDWKDKVGAFEKFNKSLNICFDKSSNPLTTTIVQFTNGNYNFFPKI